MHGSKRGLVGGRAPHCLLHQAQQTTTKSFFARSFVPYVLIIRLVITVLVTYTHLQTIMQYAIDFLADTSRWLCGESNCGAK